MDSRLFVIAARALGNAAYGPTRNAMRRYRIVFTFFLAFFLSVIAFSRTLFDFIICLLMVVLYLRCLTLPDLGFRFAQRTARGKRSS
jgi:hypothetical protein